ncbi:hypothetical protein F442_03324 [Phytophthora nicotianae P10297]|uniref:Uncharacterized protein n=1 Tax=Phytophthora nicotianae P10297 TaxID=1317064 RepID=W2ZW30_PHYNI|nr:hypothetical protein F442_03324 [Phytophthora nicotianae P10297]
MHDHIDSFRNQQYSRLIAGFDGFDFVGELTRIEKMIESQQERIQEAQNQLNLINREFLPGDIESVYRDRALTAMNDSSDKIDRLEILKDCFIFAITKLKVFSRMLASDFNLSVSNVNGFTLIGVIVGV